MREDSFVSSTGGELFSDNTTFSGSDSENQGQDMSSLDPAEQLQNSDPEPPPPSVQMPSGDEQPHVKEPHEICNGASSDLWSDAAVLSSVNESVKRVEEEHVTVVQESAEPVQEIKQPGSSEKNSSESQTRKGSQRSASIVTRKLSTDSLSDIRGTMAVSQQICRPLA
ncbi:hypothetical protein ILYODFUR_019288 [Ilyodon furcidens]|uniref:Uncharacterized protein n=1 Tax=Ilyodon furcidens TaxID=33524 RepID=A0ABV0TJV3_9TELE